MSKLINCKVKNGEYKMWHDNGQLMQQIMYVDGKKNGESKTWCYDGQLFRQRTYKDDKIIGESKIWINGKLFIKALYVDGEVHSEYKYSIDKDGNLVEDKIYQKV